MEWSFVKPLQDDLLLSIFEADYGVSIPTDLKDTILKYNNGWPECNTFYLPDKEACSLKHLLSFHKEDKENVWAYNKQENIEKGYVVFANDTFGNDIAFRIEDGAILFIDHDVEEIIEIAPDFHTFLTQLEGSSE